MDTASLLGLPLPEAQSLLQAAGIGFRLVETSARPSRASAPVWGEWRVLRVCPADEAGNAAPGGVVELLVAREMLRDERAPRDERASDEHAAPA